MGMVMSGDFSRPNSTNSFFKSYFPVENFTRYIKLDPTLFPVFKDQSLWEIGIAILLKLPALRILSIFFAKTLFHQIIMTLIY